MFDINNTDLSSITLKRVGP